MHLNPQLTQKQVKRLMRQYGVDDNMSNLSEEEKQQLRKMIEEMQGRVEDFLKDHLLQEISLKDEK